MTKVLIANRGEIACRIIRTCQSMGLASVAVYSTADAGALHTEMADEAYEIGEAPVRSSYLNMDAILEVVKKTNADMVHPGYGLLSENPEFAERIQKAGVKWVGPSPESMVAMADKERARSIAEKANVPIIGMVENMSYWSCPDCGRVDHIFGKGGVKAEAKKRGIDLLGEIPISIDVRKGSDSGIPIIISDPESIQSKNYRIIAKSILKSIKIEEVEVL